MSAERPAGAKNIVAGTVFEIGYRGEMSAYKVRLADGSLMKVSIANVNARGRPPYAEGDAVWLSWPPEAGIVLAS
jgi:putrescine transport system ATP-binding protein